MKNIQEDQLKMLYEVKAVIEKWNAIWSSNAIFTAAYTELCRIITLIEKNRDAQLASSVVQTGEKTIIWKKLVEETLFLSKRLCSFANVSKNTELQAKVYVTSTKLNVSRDSKLIGICNNLITSAQSHLTDIEPYLVTSKYLQDYQTLVQNYAVASTKPKSVRDEIKTATENLVSNFKDTNDVLIHRLDLDIEMFKASAHDFYSQYQSARMVNKTGRKTSLLVIHIVSAATKEAIENVTVTITLTSDPSVVIVKKSKKKGALYVPNLAEGNYTVKVEKIGLTTQEISILMESSRSQTMFISM